MDPIIVSAPGKVILHGEHAVVYGKAALATSVDLRCYLLLQRQPNEESVELELADFGLQRSWPLAELRGGEGTMDLARLRQLAGVSAEDDAPSATAMAVLTFLYLLVKIHGEIKKELCGLRVTVFSTLPAGAGLGSSAAYSVCLASGLLTLLGSVKSYKCQTNGHLKEELASKAVESKLPLKESSCDVESSVGVGKGGSLPRAVAERLAALIRGGGGEEGGGAGCCEGGCCWSKGELEVINRWGYEAEKLIHGTPSGIDNAISTFGGAMSYRSGEITPLDRMPNLRILLVNTKVPRSTKKMVAGVRERYDKFPGVISPILEAMDGVVEEARTRLEELATTSSDQRRQQHIHTELQELCRVNQQLLNAVGVGHPVLDEVCGLAQRHGLSAKLTGGGGGGCAITLVPPGCAESRVAELKGALTAAGFGCWETTIGSCGVTQHCCCCTLQHSART